MIAPDHDVRRRISLRHGAIAAEDHSAFLARDAQQPRAGKLRAVGHILADYSQPAREPPEHLVRDKPHRSSTMRLYFISSGRQRRFKNSTGMRESTHAARAHDLRARR